MCRGNPANVFYRKQIPSPLGVLTLTGDGFSLTGLWVEGQKHFPASLPEALEGTLPVFGQTEQWLRLYFSGQEPDFLPPLAPRGTDFQRAVWAQLLEIPYGKTVSYGEIARRLAERGGPSRVSARAVGGAVGRNPISILIPCHRVIGADGSLTGYDGGLERKRQLLALEGIPVFAGAVPSCEAQQAMSV